MPGYKIPELPREKVISILHKAAALDPGDELYIPALSKPHCRQIIRNLFKELSIMAHILPEETAKIDITSTFKDKRFWVKLSLAQPDLSTVFVKSHDGEVSKIDISGKETE